MLYAIAMGQIIIVCPKIHVARPHLLVVLLIHCKMNCDWFPVITSRTADSVTTDEVTLVLDEVEMMTMTSGAGDGTERRLKVDGDAVRLRCVQADLAPLRDGRCPVTRPSTCEPGVTARQRQLNGPVAVLDDEPQRPARRLDRRQQHPLTRL